MISYLLNYQGTLNPYGKRTSGEIMKMERVQYTSTIIYIRDHNIWIPMLLKFLN